MNRKLLSVLFRYVAKFERGELDFVAAAGRIDGASTRYQRRTGEDVDQEFESAMLALRAARDGAHAQREAERAAELSSLRKPVEPGGQWRAELALQRARTRS